MDLVREARLYPWVLATQDALRLRCARCGALEAEGPQGTEVGLFVVLARAQAFLHAHRDCGPPKREQGNGHL